MAKFQRLGLINYIFKINSVKFLFCANRGILSESYLCEESWKKRLENPILKDINMDHYFVETDKKFGTKRSVSGVDIDLFANSIANESQLEELEHLLYRFRKTRRSTEMMDSTVYAVIKEFLKYKQYESLFRILNTRDSYGIFPDFYSYNNLMSTFLKENLYKEAALTAILMMQQEDFSNKISCILGLYSCQMFLNNCSLESLGTKKELVVENTEEEDEDDVTLVRVPFLKNPWFDDHFHITDPKHLIGKTFYLIGRERKDILGHSYQLIGLAMYEKWEKLANVMELFAGASNSDILNSAVDVVKQEINSIPDDENKTKENILSKFDVFTKEMKSSGKIIDKDLMAVLDSCLKESLQYEKDDIEAQEKLFCQWENDRKAAIRQQDIELDKEKRLKVIEEKKEYLLWKEKLLFFFENEHKLLDEYKNVEELMEKMKASAFADDAYVPTFALSRPKEELTKYKKLANVKKLSVK